MKAKRVNGCGGLLYTRSVAQKTCAYIYQAKVDEGAGDITKVVVGQNKGAWMESSRSLQRLG